MGSLANKILEVATQNESNSGAITKALSELVSSIESFTTGINGIYGTTGEIRENVDKITARTQNMLALMLELETATADPAK